MRFFIGGIMSNIEQQLAELRQSTLDRLKEIHHEGEKELQDLRVSVLGKKGSLTKFKEIFEEY